MRREGENKKYSRPNGVKVMEINLQENVRKLLGICTYFSDRNKIVYLYRKHDMRKRKTIDHVMYKKK